MIAIKPPTEHDFDTYVRSSLECFSQRIRASGLSLYMIARLAGVSWKTVQKAVEMVPIRFDNAERIKLVISRYGDNCENCEKVHK